LQTPGCLVEQLISAVLDGAFAEVEALLLRRMGEVTLADLTLDSAWRQQGHPE